jgi:hypothetical protein
VLAALAAHRLGQGLDRESGRFALDEDYGECVPGLRTGAGNDDEVAGELGVRYQPFASVDDVGAAVAFCGRADVGAGAVVGLGEGERDRELAAGDARQQLLSLFFRAELVDGVREGVVDVGEDADAAVTFASSAAISRYWATVSPDPP